MAGPGLVLRGGILPLSGRFDGLEVRGLGLKAKSQLQKKIKRTKVNLWVQGLGGGVLKVWSFGFVLKVTWALGSVLEVSHGFGRTA